MGYFDTLDHLEYLHMVHKGYETIEKDAVQRACEEIHKNLLDGRPILTFGNGGSAAVAQHAATDLYKCVVSDCPQLIPDVRCLSSNQDVLTAISNDIGYALVFSWQIVRCIRSRLVIGISSSGNSPNICIAMREAKKRGKIVIGLVGFDGGAVKRENLADILIHVVSNNYGVCEDCHSMVIHAISQHIRLNSCEDYKLLKL
jgi:D-sedoheptulose 7-phosphate isomerase